MSYPVISQEDFVSPADKAGNPVFYRVFISNLDKLARGTTVFTTGVVSEAVLAAAQKNHLTLHLLDKVPMHVFNEMSRKDQKVWRHRL